MQRFEILKQLPAESEAVWRYFLALTEIPRGSFHLECIQPALRAMGTALGLEVIQDKGGNVIIKKPAHPECTGKPTVALQAHFDMVCQADNNTTIDFKKDPITPRIDGEWLKATGTSLGADNGIGIAAAFAVLEDKTLKHGPIEVVITRDEEVGLFGAEELDPTILKADYLINLDSEEEKAICIGCAGGHNTTAKIPANRVDAREDVAVLKVEADGMTGGHTGVDIQLGRANAMKVLARMMVHVLDAKFRLHEFDAGSADNAIPRSCAAVVEIPTEGVEAFKAKLEKVFAAIKEEYKVTDPNMVLNITEAESEKKPCDDETTAKCVRFLNVVPYGVVRMHPTEAGFVQTSFTMAIVKTEETHFECTTSARSSADSQLKMMYETFHSLCEGSGVEVTGIENAYPGWDPKPTSPLLLAAKEVHRDVCECDAKVYAIHAGLECGMIQGLYPELECISIGPTIENPHSPDEKMLIRTVPKFYELLVGILERM
eukprot:TRINITY_DN709_c0_g1_i2.p1 TRINITY_DN709_c0_g1~~TRINITY_DN709_c0_g1_i2.p1  ORF type:complete len:488 (+),score=200.82 TRINITY_DN709_c0_g1_i2:51-1514(+)